MPPERRSTQTWVEVALAKRLQEVQGFESYGALRKWLLAELRIEAPFKTLHKLVDY